MARHAIVSLGRFVSLSDHHTRDIAAFAEFTAKCSTIVAETVAAVRAVATDAAWNESRPLLLTDMGGLCDSCSETGARAAAATD